MPENISHYKSSNFWQSYYELPLKVQKIADQKYKLLKENYRHPSLKLKRIRTLWGGNFSPFIIKKLMENKL